MHSPKTQLGRALRTRRLERGLGLAAAADQVGVARSTLATAERGEAVPSPPTAWKLASWLGWTWLQVCEAAVTRV
jgi:transcriptional regulator with XRE-family HTH domain